MDENEMKSFENRLRSWRPRRPSPTLEWRLFRAPTRFALRSARWLGWLAPVAACAWLAVLGLDSESAVSGGIHPPSILALASNQSYTVFATSRQSVQNNPSLFTSDWTNRSNSGSIPHFAP